MKNTVSPMLRPTAPWPVLLDNIPILYEDEELGDMGQTNPHTLTDEIFHTCVSAHLKARRPELQAFANMNCYYLEGPPHSRTGSLPYISPDLMVVHPFHPLPKETTSYTIGKHGPQPLLAGEILSERTAQERDLDEKLIIYAKLGIGEYILVDPTGQHLPQKLLLKRLLPDRTWKDEQDADGGVTSVLGFRLMWDEQGDLSVVDVITGRPYIRPAEAEEEAEARRGAEEQARQEAGARRQAEAAQHQAEAARQRAEAVRQRAQAAQQKAEADRQQAEADRQRAEAERQQAEAERQQAEAERQQAEVAQQQAEAARQQAEENARAEAAARRQVEEQLRALQEELKRRQQDPEQRKT